jgi:hypothetical protein
MRTRLLDDLEGDDPILSVVNLIDVFLVIIAALLIAVASHPLSPFAAGDATLIRNPGQQDMEIVVKKGDRISRFQGEGEASAGRGVKAGTAYRMEDGSLVYVPE